LKNEIGITGTPIATQGFTRSL